jgi:DNA invertase Pin-like site-specific DNA recombinase
MANKAIALYMRISKDDGNNQESNSIANQRVLLRQYIANDPQLSDYPVLEFCDDGFSGTNFERPEIKKLLEKIRQGMIYCIIVKDFSRFGRNYIEVGGFLEQYFPFLGIRFISIGDQYDSQKHNAATGMEYALKTLIYDIYSKDISVKVKSALNEKKRRGEYAAGRAPYGYAKSAQSKTTLEIDEPAAAIIRYIFRLAAQGKSRADIARILNSEGMPTRSRKPGSFWKRSDISDILSNETYTGALVVNKSTKPVVGGKQVPVPKKQQVLIPNTHPAIITQEIFKAAQLSPKSPNTC